MMNMINTIVTLVTIILLLVLLVVTVVVGTIWPRVFSRSVRGVCTPVIRPGVFQTKIIIKIEDSYYTTRFWQTARHLPTKKWRRMRAK